MTFKAFIFDLDGVITDTAHFHFLAWKKLADSLGIPFNEHDNERLKGVSRRQSLEFILAKSDKNYSEEEILAMMEKKNDDYIELIKGITPADILPGVREIFAELKQRGFKTALASASKNAAFVIGGLGMQADFDYIADANIIPNSKPAPDVFLDCAEHLGIAPADCVGVEDAAAGVEAINAAGMFSVGVGDADILGDADMVFADMQALDINTILQRR